MRIWRRLRSGWGAVFGRARVESELDAELRFHVEAHAEDLMRAGMSREEALRQARVKLGGLERTKEECRDALGVSLVESVIQDVRFGLRMLRKNPGFTAVAVITLALGIGVNTAMFSVVEGVLLAPLPYRSPDRLVTVWESNSRVPIDSISYPNFRDWQRDARSFKQMAAIVSHDYDLASPGTPEHLDGDEVTAGFFTTIGAKLLLGRDIAPAEDTRGGAPVVIISNALWDNRFGGSPNVLGKTLVLNGVSYTVVGSFRPNSNSTSGSRADVYTPFGQGDPLMLDTREGHPGINSIARLGPGVSLSQARAEMSTVQKNLDRIYPEADEGTGTAVIPLKQFLVRNVSRTLLLLLGAVGLLLLIAGANFANLLLARLAGRTRELAVRSALGANRRRVMRQLVTESLVLSWLRLRLWPTSKRGPSTASRAAQRPREGRKRGTSLRMTAAVAAATRASGKEERGIGGADAGIAHFPDGDEHAGEFVGEHFCSGAGLPPGMRIVLGIRSRHDAKDGASRESALADIAGAARVVIRGDQEDAFPAARRDELRERSGFVLGIFRVLIEANDGAGGDAAIGEVVLLEFGDGGVGAQVASAGDDVRRHSGFE